MTTTKSAATASTTSSAASPAGPAAGAAGAAAKSASDTGSQNWGRKIRRRFRLTREGRGYVFVTLGVGVGAVNTGNNLLYLILGLLLSLLLVSGTLSDLSLYRLRVRRRLPGRLFVGRAARVEVELENLKERLPSYSLDLREELPEKDAYGRALKNQAAREEAAPIQWARAYAVHLAPLEVKHLAYVGTPRKRGVHTLPAVRVVTRYPFGLIEKVSRRSTAREVLVYPAIHEVAAPALPAERGAQLEEGRRRGYGNEIIGLRDAREGDAQRDIHWRKSASRGALVTRERAEDRDRRVVLLVDEGTPRPLLTPAADTWRWTQKPPSPAQIFSERWRQDFEERVSHAASLAVAALKSGASVVVQSRGGRSPRVEAGAAPDPILAFLARLEPIVVGSGDGDDPEQNERWRSAGPRELVVDVGADAPSVGSTPPQGEPAGARTGGAK